MSHNPFTFGNPIKEPAGFIGREAEIRQITNRLLSSAHESTSIIGERRIGKTSLLYHLSHPEVSARLGLTRDKFCLVYVDFQGLTDITPARFWQRILKKMARSVCDDSLKAVIEKTGESEEFDLFDLEDLFEASQDKGITTVLMLDEFEYITQNPNFKGEFFGGLRALAIHHGVALLPATRRELVDLCHSEEIKGSPFFNIFANVILRPFSKEEVDIMLANYAAAGGLDFSPEENDFVWAMGGGYPFFVQMAGHYLADGKLQSLNGDALTLYAAENFDQQADSHYSYLWSHCSESEKIALLVLLACSAGKEKRKTIPNLENLSRMRARIPHDLLALSKRGLVAEDAGLYTIFSPAFMRWVSREISALPGEEESQESAEEWLKSDGVERIDAIKGVLPGVKKKYWRLLLDVSKDLSINLAASGVFELAKLLLVSGL
jgi:hypothetical protein